MPNYMEVMKRSSYSFKKHMDEEELEMQRIKEILKALQDDSEYFKDYIESNDIEIDRINDFINQLAKDLGLLEDEVENLDLGVEDLNKKVNAILKYFEYDEEEETLQHHYDKYPLAYNQEYISEVSENISVDVIGGIVYYDLRFFTKKAISTGDYIKLALTPNDYDPVISAPSSFIVRQQVVLDGVLTPKGEPEMLEGIGIFSHSVQLQRGEVILKALDDIPAERYIYFSGSYLMKPSKTGRLDLDKTIPTDAGFVAKENL